MITADEKTLAYRETSSSEEWRDNLPPQNSHATSNGNAASNMG